MYVHTRYIQFTFAKHSRQPFWTAIWWLVNTLLARLYRNKTVKHKWVTTKLHKINAKSAAISAVSYIWGAPVIQAS